MVVKKVKKEIEISSQNSSILFDKEALTVKGSVIVWPENVSFF
jgi:hypothetical protein